MATVQLTCGKCGQQFVEGDTTCKSCLGTIAYGATGEELASGAAMWGFIFLVLALLVIFYLPEVLFGQFGMAVPDSFGMGPIIGGILAILVAGAAGFYGHYRARKAHAGQVRTFR